MTVYYTEKPRWPVRYILRSCCLPTSSAIPQKQLCNWSFRGYTGHAPPLCGWAPGQCGDDPVSAVVDDRLAAEGKTALLMVWDNASWHISQAVRVWLKTHNRRVKRDGGCRLVVCPLPSKSPWLNRIEPKWVHGKRAIAEPDRKLHVDELKHRLCAYYDCERLEPIAQ